MPWKSQPFAFDTPGVAVGWAPAPDAAGEDSAGAAGAAGAGVAGAAPGAVPGAAGAGAGAGWVIAGVFGSAPGGCSEMQEAPRRVVPAGQGVGATIVGSEGSAAGAWLLRLAACSRRRFWAAGSCL